MYRMHCYDTSVRVDATIGYTLRAVDHDLAVEQASEYVYEVLEKVNALLREHGHDLQLEMDDYTWCVDKVGNDEC